MDTTKLLKLELRRIQDLLEMLPVVEKPKGYLERVGRSDKSSYRIVRYVNGHKRTYNIGDRHSPEVKRFVRDLFLHTRRRILEYDESQLDDCLSKIQSYGVLDTIELLPRTVRKLCSTLGFVDEQFEELKRWAAEDVERNPAPMPETINRACDGTLTRSKGECIIYDLLVSMGIPFRYDSEFEVIDDWGNIKTIYPDFVIKCYDGNYVIIEHLGGLDKADYCSRFANTLRYYLRCKYVIGKNLFLTSDNEEHGTEANYIFETLQIVEDRFWHGVVDNSEFMEYS